MSENSTSPSSRRQEQLQAFDRLLTIMDELREQCPWDRKQTMDSLKHLTVEETYELNEAIADGDMGEVKKELGDLMMHMVFYSKIGSENGDFDVADVLNGVCEKLILRHPHIYGDVNVENADQVAQNWEQIKLKEKGGNKTVLGGVPKGLPALIKAMRIQEKARGVGFDWEKPEQVWGKVEEEIGELKEEVRKVKESKASIDEAQKEFGDVMFSMINYARFVGINPEDALDQTNRKFIFRFNYLEQAVKESGLNLSDLSLEEMDKYWNEAKKLEKGY